MKALLNRLKEPSTWAGIAALVTAFGVPGEQVQAVAQIAVAVTGAVAVFMPEKAGNAP